MKYIEFVVGLFMLAGVAALLMLAFRVSGLTQYAHSGHYQLVAEFDNIGDLKVRAPVRVAGVRIGQIADIDLDNKTYRAKVVLEINEGDDQLPTDTSAAIQTAGLLGSNYVSLTPGYAETYLKDGGKIEVTHPAIILENLIGQMIFHLKNGKE